MSRSSPILAIVRPVRRGLLKDLANTPTQIACGWRLYGDLPRLRELSGSAITVDLFSGRTTVEGRDVSPPLQIADETTRWLTERFSRDEVPAGTVTAARLTLTPVIDERGTLTVECVTELETPSQTYDSRDSTRWVREDQRAP